MKDLHIDTKNSRVHNQRNIDTIAASLELSGQQTPLVILQDGTILKGNGTYLAAKQLGAKTIAAVVYSGDQDTADLYAVNDNRTSELAEWDFPSLSEALGEFQQQGVDLEKFGWSEHDLEPLLAANWQPAQQDGTLKSGNISLLSAVELTTEERDVFDKAADMLRDLSGVKLRDGEVVVLLCDHWKADQ